MDPEARKAKVLRAIVVGVGVLAALDIVLGFVPGVEVLDDANDCFGQAFGALFSHGRAGSCESHYVVTHVRSCSEHPWVMAIYFAVVAGLGGLVYLRPKLKHALAWSLLTVVATALMLVKTFELHLFEHENDLWTATLYGISALAIIVTVILAVPIYSAIFAIVNRKPRPPELARARIHKS